MSLSKNLFYHLLEQQKDKAIYVDKETSKEYSINGFRGFIHEEFLKDCGVANWDKYVINTDYIGPFRICPKRTYSLQSSSCYRKIGIDGIQAYNNLICSNKCLCPLHVTRYVFIQKSFLPFIDIKSNLMSKPSSYFTPKDRPILLPS